MCGEELHFVNEAFASNYIAPLGPMVDAFEAEFAKKTGIENTLAVCSGTAAMHRALRIFAEDSESLVESLRMRRKGGKWPFGSNDVMI